MPQFLDEALAAYCELKDHFDHFVSQACYTDVDAAHAWCITKDKRSLLIVTASDGCTYLLRGSYVGDLSPLQAQVHPGSEGDALLQALEKYTNSHKVLTSHFRVQATELMLDIFTGCCVFDPPLALPLEMIQAMPLAEMFSHCLRLQKGFETFATQLTGECIKLERLHHIYVPETSCSAYIHHTTDTETPFSYVLLKGSHISPMQAGNFKNGCSMGHNGLEKKNMLKGSEREVLTRQQLLAIVDENFCLKQNLPVYRWTVAHNVAKGFRGGQEFLRERCPPIGAKLAKLRQTLASLKSHSDPAEASPTPAQEPLSPGIPATMEEFAKVMEQTKEKLKERYTSQILILHKQQEAKLQQLRTEHQKAEAEWRSQFEALLHHGMSGENGKHYAVNGTTQNPYLIPMNGEPLVEVNHLDWRRAMKQSLDGVPAMTEGDEALAAELQRLRKSYKAIQKSKAELERKGRECAAKVDELQQKCSQLEEELVQTQATLDEERTQCTLQREQLEAKVAQLEQELDERMNCSNCTEMEERLAECQRRRTEEVEKERQAARQQLEHAKTQYSKQLAEQRRSLRQQCDTDRLVSENKLYEEMAAKEQQWADQRGTMEATHKKQTKAFKEKTTQLEREAASLKEELDQRLKEIKAKEEEKFELSTELRRLRLLHEQQMSAVTASWEREVGLLQKQMETLLADNEKAKAQCSQLRDDMRKAAEKAKQNLHRELEKARNFKNGSASSHKVQKRLEQLEETLENERTEHQQQLRVLKDNTEHQVSVLRDALRVAEQQASQASESKIREGLARAKYYEEEILQFKAETDLLLGQSLAENHRLADQCTVLQEANQDLQVRLAQLEEFTQGWVKQTSDRLSQASFCSTCAHKRQEQLALDRTAEPCNQPTTVEEWETECRGLREFVEELQCRLRTTLLCAAQMHADCEARLQEERKALRLQQREQQLELDRKVQLFEMDKQQCQEAYGRLLVQIQEQYQQLLRAEKRTLHEQQCEASKQLDQRRMMLDHLMTVQTQWYKRSALDMEAEQNSLRLAAADALESTPCRNDKYTVMSPSSQEPPIPLNPVRPSSSSTAASSSSSAPTISSSASASRSLLFGWSPRISAAAASSVGVGSGSVLASLTDWWRTPE